METLITVLITLMVVALIVAVINLVRLNRKADELDTLKLEMIDISDKIDNMIEGLGRALNRRADDMERDYINRIESWVASTDRRFDKIWHEFNEETKTKKSY